MALFNKGVALRALDRADQALESYGEVVARFGDDAMPAIQAVVDFARQALADDG